jgi:hypothetical protein
MRISSGFFAVDETERGFVESEDRRPDRFADESLRQRIGGERVVVADEAGQPEEGGAGEHDGSETVLPRCGLNPESIMIRSRRLP